MCICVPSINTLPWMAYLFRGRCFFLHSGSWCCCGTVGVLFLRKRLQSPSRRKSSCSTGQRRSCQQFIHHEFCVIITNSSRWRWIYWWFLLEQCFWLLYDNLELLDRICAAELILYIYRVGFILKIYVLLFSVIINKKKVPNSQTN